ncbi:MAG: IS21-like element helper ATPase IstB [Thermoanaerobaculia bacterium]
MKERAAKLGLWGLLAHWEEVGEAPWLAQLLHYEEEERRRRSLERRLRTARIGRFKAMADFDWVWPKKIDRELVDDLFRLEFLGKAMNVVLVGPNGVGKSMIAQNLAYAATLKGFTVRMVNASELLCELAAQETGQALVRRVRRYAWPQLLVIDEVGYLGSTAQHADLLFEVVSRRYEEKSTVLTTNKPFSEWNQIFPNAGCVVSLVDRLVHRAEVVEIQGESYRLKEAQERQAAEARKRAQRKRKRS